MSKSPTEFTAAATILATLVLGSAVLGTGWALYQLPAWASGIGKFEALLIIAGGAGILLGIAMAAALTYAALAILLEVLGIKVLRPVQRKLEEVAQEAAAAGRMVHVVWYTYKEDDEFGEEVSWGVPLTIHGTKEAAEADRAKRSGPPGPKLNPNGAYVVADPCNLAALGIVQLADEDAIRTFLREGVAHLKPEVWYGPHYYSQYLKSSPLNDEELASAEKARVWTVYYEDQFRTGPSRETFPVAICLSAAEAEAEVAKRGPLKQGFDGYLQQGPYALVPRGKRSPDVGADVVREVLRRIEAKAPGPIPVG